MKKSKKLLSILLTICMLLSAVPMMAFTASAEESVTGYVPVYAYWADESLGVPASATFDFEIEAVTQNAPMPASTTMSIEAPTQKGEANKVGYSSSDTSNPWAITFTDNGTYKYKVTQTTVDSNDFVCDKHEFAVWAVVDKSKTPAVEFLTQQIENVTLEEEQFNVVKINDETEMSVSVANGITSITLGGGNNKATGTASYDKYNIGAAKSKYGFDFAKDFQVTGTLSLDAVPDGCTFGFVTSKTDTINTEKMYSGGCLGIYWDGNNQFANGIFVEFDGYSNGNEVADNNGDNIGVNYSHIDIIKTNQYSGPEQVTRLKEVGNVANLSGYHSVLFENDASESELKITINKGEDNELTYTYDYSETALKNSEGYFVFSGVERYDCTSVEGLLENNLTVDQVSVMQVSISSIQFYADKESENAEVKFCNTAKVKYDVTAGSATNGTVTLAASEYYPGDKVTVTTTPVSGYELNKIYVNGTAIKGTTFTMPENDVTVTATFKVIVKDTITLGRFNKTTGTFENATATDNNTYQCFTITLADNVNGSESITLPSVDGYTVVNELSTDYSKTIAITEEKTATEIMEDYFSQVQFSNCDSQHVSVLLNRDAPKGKVAYNVENEHYYMYVEFDEDNVLDWVQSYNDAKNTYFMGRQGYLATITSKDEDLFIYKVCGDAVGWLGATNLNPGTQSGQYYEFTGITESDESCYNNKWIWACGPEAGDTLFDVATLANDEFNDEVTSEAYARNYNNTYHNWGTNPIEPNNITESCLTTLPFGFGYATSDDLPNNDGVGTYSWNNVEYNRTILPSAGGSKYSEDDQYAPAGYVIEFGNLTIGNDAEENSGYYVSAVGDFSCDFEITNSNPQANEATNNGYLEISKLQAEEGETVTVTATPASGYGLTKLYYQVGSEAKQEITLGEDGYTFSMPDGDVTVSAEFAAIPVEFDSAVYYASTSINRDIDLKFSIKNIPDVSADKLAIYVDGEEVDVKLESGVASCTLKSFNPEDIYTGIRIVIKYDGVTIKDFTYKVSDYCDKVIEIYGNSSDDAEIKFVDLCKALLNYGKYAEDYANKDNADFVARTLADTAKIDYSNVSVSTATGTSAEADNAAASLSLGSTISLNFYVKSENEITEDDVEVYNNLENPELVKPDYITVTESDDENYDYKITVKNIAAEQISRAYTLKINGVSVISYGVDNYCSAAQTEFKDDETLTTLCKAIYYYGETAKAFAATQKQAQA